MGKDVDEAFTPLPTVRNVILWPGVDLFMFIKSQVNLIFSMMRLFSFCFVLEFDPQKMI